MFPYGQKPINSSPYVDITFSWWDIANKEYEQD